MCFCALRCSDLEANVNEERIVRAPNTKISLPANRHQDYNQ